MARHTKMELPTPDELFYGGYLCWQPEFQVEVVNANDTIHSAKLVVTYDQALLRYACTSISVTPPGEGAELTGATLRDIRIAETMQAAALDNIWVEAAVVPGNAGFVYNFDKVDYYSAASALRALPEVSGRTTDSDVKNAVTVYAIAQISGSPVLRTISEALNTSQSTSKRLVKRARELRYLKKKDDDE